jgi:hypothetical protein
MNYTSLKFTILYLINNKKAIRNKTIYIMKNFIVLIILSIFSFETYAQQTSSLKKEDENYIPNLIEKIGNKLLYDFW